MARVMILCTLPHRELAVAEFARRNGQAMMSIINRAAIGLPYGRYPRLLLCWLTTEAVLRKSRHLELGESFNAFMHSLGLHSQSGGARGIRSGLRDQMMRLFSATISVTFTEAGQFKDHGLRVAEHIDLWWHPQDPRERGPWDSRVALSRDFFEAIVERPVPIDVRVLRALRSPFAIDLYCWLTYRMSYLQRPTLIPWVALAEQFGHGYGRLCDFRKRLLLHLRSVQKVYDVDVQAHQAGLELRPGATHVARR